MKPDNYTNGSNDIWNVLEAMLDRFKWILRVMDGVSRQWVKCMEVSSLPSHTEGKGSSSFVAQVAL